MSDAQPDDSLFLHYSGHGVQMKDGEGDEVDGLDEVIIPLDFKKGQWDSMIRDDDLKSLLTTKLPKGVRDRIQGPKGKL